MQLDDAITLIRSSVAGHEGVWADMGAGRGTFTRALAKILGAESRIYAVDSDAPAIAELKSWAETEAPNVTAIEGDFTKEIELPPLDGVLLANALHFVKDQTGVLTGLVKRLRPKGRVVILEYDKRAPSRWVPHPISIADLPAFAKAAGLSRFTVAESRPSNYEGIIYTAFADRVDAGLS